MTLALAALLVAGGCGGLVFPCSADLSVGDRVELTLADAWGYGTAYEWNAVRVPPREGPWCDGVDALSRGASIRLQVAELVS